MKGTTIKKPYRVVLLLLLVFILLKNISLTLLVADITAYLEIVIHLIILYLILQNHRFTETAIWLWATLYLFAFTAVQAGAKSLIIMRGDSWEVDKVRYYIELFMIILGLFFMFLGEKIYDKKEA